MLVFYQCIGNFIYAKMVLYYGIFQNCSLPLRAALTSDHITSCGSETNVKNGYFSKS